MVARGLLCTHLFRIETKKNSREALAARSPASRMRFGMTGMPARASSREASRASSCRSWGVRSAFGDPCFLREAGLAGRIPLRRGPFRASVLVP